MWSGGQQKLNQDNQNEDISKEDEPAGSPDKAPRKKGVNLGITQELRVLKIDPNMTPEQRALVEQIEHMREQSKAIGSGTEVLDEYVKKELAPELKSNIEDKDKNQK